MNFINETNERIEKRVMSLEANLLGLGVIMKIKFIERLIKRSRSNQ